MSLSEEELDLLFEYIDAAIDAKDRASGLEEQMRANELKQDCINVIAFGEKLDE